MQRSRPAHLVLLTALLAACGGGGGDGTPPADTFRLAGTISVAAGQVMDSDTGDSRDVPKTSNDTLAQAQVVPSAAAVGGWVSETADDLDYYRARLAAGQAAVLTISDAGVDLDLCLQDVAAARAPICSLGTTAVESVTVPEADDYYIEVFAAAGASNYVMTLGVTASAAPPGPGTLRSGTEFVPGELLVRFREEALGPAAAAAADELRARASALGLAPLGGAVRGRPALLGLGASPEARARALSVLGAERAVAGTLGAPVDGLAAARLDTLRAIKALRQRADVESADPNYVFHPSAVPPNDYYAFQWHYPLVSLPQAWDVTQGSSGVIVAVVDTGVYLDHPDFAGRAQLVQGYDFISSAAISNDGDGRDANPDDPGDASIAGQSSWHGTHVAGTVAAAWRAGKGAAGVAPGARVMPLRTLGVGGGSSADIIEAIRYAAQLSNASGGVPAQKADVVNLSLGCLGCFSTTEAAAYAAVRAAGVVIVAAAGNENSTQPGYPASYDGVISVSAVDIAQARAPYSNSGPNVDVAAPGGNTGADRDGNGYADGVLSAVANDSTGTRTAGWVFYQGTSMASPHVAGVVALMKSVCDTLTPDQVDTILSSGEMTRDLGAAGRDDVFGHGLVDAALAVQAAQEQCGIAPPPGAEVSPTRLDFGSAATGLGLTLARTGGPGALSVTATATTAAWLGAAQGAVDANGFGPYQVTATRAGLADGRYSAAVRFTLSDGKTVEVPVSLQVGAPAGAGDAGYLYVLLVDSTFEGAAQDEGSGSGGGLYPFAFTGVPEGSYFLVAGTDSDDDGFICDEGEVCGAWPTLGVPNTIEAAADVTGLDFLVGLDVGFGTGAAQAGEGRGFRRLGAAKVLGGAR